MLGLGLAWRPDAGATAAGGGGGDGANGGAVDFGLVGLGATPHTLVPTTGLCVPSLPRSLVPCRCSSTSAAAPPSVRNDPARAPPSLP